MSISVFKIVSLFAQVSADERYINLHFSSLSSLLSPQEIDINGNNL